ncbi:hypothetical protein [Parafrankia elaeagni]|uniref:hypothetical protein n=1 Tax=Parafrankia elaeagni TaxID=222534 RepID=UPI000368AB13|nr:hypothetical protein [Parafrankia elaeagni]
MTAFLAFLGLGLLTVLVVGLVALARGRLLRARIRSRRAATGVTVTAVIVFGVCVASIPQTDPDAPVSQTTSAAPDTPGSFIRSSAVEQPPTIQPPVAPVPAPARPVASIGVPPVASVAPIPPADPAPPAAVDPPRVPEPPVPPPAPPTTADSRAGCDSSYPDACLRTGDYDYDCEGGEGNGPNYVRGPLRVTSPDPFDLDRDGDGTGCDS